MWITSHRQGPTTVFPSMALLLQGTFFIFFFFAASYQVPPSILQHFFIHHTISFPSNTPISLSPRWIVFFRSSYCVFFFHFLPSKCISARHPPSMQCKASFHPRYLSISMPPKSLSTFPSPAAVGESRRRLPAISHRPSAPTRLLSHKNVFFYFLIYDLVCVWPKQISGKAYVWYGSSSCSVSGAEIFGKNRM